MLAEPPVSAAALLRGMRARPLSTRVLIDLIGVAENLPIADALFAESLAYGLLQGASEHRDWLAARALPTSEPSGCVHLERTGDVLSICIDRPRSRNAIDRTLRDGLFEAFTLAALDDEVVGVELRSTGRTFSVGADLAEFGTTRDPAQAYAIRMQTLPALPLSRCAGKVNVHVQGACIGAGLEIAAFAARVIATRNAWFQLPELSMGLIPGAGGCVSITRRIGPRRVALMVLSGRRIPAHVALDWGLVDAIVDD